MDKTEENQCDNGNSEQFRVSDAFVPGSASKLGTRIGVVCGRVGWDVAAQASGKSVKQLRRYVQGGDPPASVLEGLARISDISVQWLVTGCGPMMSSDSQPHQALDEDLMARVVDGISKTYKEVGARIAPVDLGRLAARIANDIVAVSDGPDDWPGALKMALRTLARDLRATPVESNSTKRSA
ncbi:hypothetical protein [Pararhodospirillum oryzae]|uniref:Uncharacterized protein n=1 Tax=Pararhodospirillum oryzae TaxID=478448 RepID=A0A512HC93_9PROT|nr:hypothetical protein [Pararhodospirillum oryzae]GEO83051.1 hypothetical protein ROR02_31820 [Pararhodospirillum oryzae]